MLALKVHLAGTLARLTMRGFSQVGLFLEPFGIILGHVGGLTITWTHWSEKAAPSMQLNWAKSRVIGAKWPSAMQPRLPGEPGVGAEAGGEHPPG